MNNSLILMTGEDIPFISAQLTIHQPKISEISMIGERNFWSGSYFLNFDKNLLSDKDKTVLSEKSDFEIFMSMMSSKEKNDYKDNAKLVLSLLFPQYSFKFTELDILLSSDTSVARINNTNYGEFKDILTAMFELDSKEENDYNPADKRAEKIAEKLKKRKKGNKEESQGEKQISIFEKYISILSIGLQLDCNVLKQCTVYQLKDMFNRFQKKHNFDVTMRAKLAGATGVDEVNNWME